MLTHVVDSPSFKYRRVALLATSVVLVGVGFSSVASAQGETGFLRGRGKLDAVAYYHLDRYDEFWMGGTTVKNSAMGFGDVDRLSYGLYAAYGVTEEVDLVANLSWVSARADRGFDRESDLQDGTLRVKWRLFEQSVGNSHLSFLVAPGIKTPLTNYEDNSVTAIGDGQTDYYVRGILHARHDSGVFLSIESGYDIRSGRPKDELPLHITAGTSIGPVTISPYYSRVDSLGGIDLGQGHMTRAEEDFERIGISMFGRVNEHLGLTAGARTTLDGRNTGKIESLGLGLVVRF